MLLRRVTFAAVLVAATAVLIAQDRQGATVIAVDAAHPGAAMSPKMFGIFFEDINFAADGGLYPERIKNRSFEFSEPLAGWRKVVPGDQGELDVRGDNPLNASNPHYLRVRVYQPGLAVANSGFRGIGVESGAEYRFSTYVRSSGPRTLRASIEDENGRAIGAGTLSGFDGAWKRYETTIRPSATTQHATFTLHFDEQGAMDLDMVSLYPVDTWGHRPNGLRKDLVQLLYDMHPGFIRFPGGCIVEGRRLATRYRWKTTVGDIAQRKTIINRWNNEFDTRPAPDYFQSFGLGFYEYFQLAEDVGAEPLPILNCGMACEFNSAELAPVDQLNEYIQDALDLIDFANGPATSGWGKLRAEMGHPEPFHLRMIGVGNEQWGPHYLERYTPFAAAVKAKHPEIELVVSAGPSPDGAPFDYLWAHWRKAKADIVDEHYYQAPEWFLANTGRYDHYDRSGPKVFAGEYAAQTAGVARTDNRNNWRGAIAEAAFMTGLERNADVVRMASYAPLFAHVEAWQWKPDAIWFDNLRSYGTPNYYVQRVFASNTGTRIIPATSRVQDGLYASAALDERTHELIVKAVNATGDARHVEVRLDGARLAGAAKVTVLASADLEAENSFDEPTHVAPRESTAEVKEGVVAATIGPYSVNVWRVGMR